MNNKLLLLCLILVLNIKAEKFFFSSVPKAGTNLLFKFLELLTKKNGIQCPLFIDGKSLPEFNPEREFVYWHITFSAEAVSTLKNNNFKNLLIYRDPRDQIVSHAFWIIKNSYLFEECNFEGVCPFTIKEIIEKLIKNVKNLYHNYYLAWLQYNLFFLIKFEDIIGEKGGGSKQTQFNTIKNIANYLEINISEKEINEIIDNLFGGTATFREGKIGSWKQYFDDDLKKLFKENSGDLLQILNYEPNNNW